MIRRLLRLFFISPEEETKLMMPPLEECGQVYRPRIMFRERLNVRILNLEGTQERRRNVFVNPDEGVQELLGKPERVDLSGEELDRRWAAYEELERKMLGIPSALVAADEVELHWRYSI